VRLRQPTVTVTPAPGWWNGRHSRLKSGSRKACGFDSRPGHRGDVYSLVISVRSISMSNGTVSFSSSWWMPVNAYAFVAGSSSYT
jgi:hypothetical protein